MEPWEKALQESLTPIGGSGGYRDPAQVAPVIEPPQYHLFVLGEIPGRRQLDVVHTEFDTQAELQEYMDSQAAHWHENKIRAWHVQGTCKPVQTRKHLKYEAVT